MNSNLNEKDLVEMRNHAVDYALRNKPATTVSGTGIVNVPKYDLIEESNKIYQFLLNGYYGKRGSRKK